MNSSVSLQDYQDHDIEKGFKEHQDDLVKAARQGLTRKRITDKTGKVTTVWVKTGEDVKEKKGKRGKQDSDEAKMKLEKVSDSVAKDLSSAVEDTFKIKLGKVKALRATEDKNKSSESLVTFLRDSKESKVIDEQSDHGEDVAYGEIEVEGNKYKFGLMGGMNDDEGTYELYVLSDPKVIDYLKSR